MNSKLQAETPNPTSSAKQPYPFTRKYHKQTYETLGRFCGKNNPIVRFRPQIHR